MQALCACVQYSKADLHAETQAKTRNQELCMRDPKTHPETWLLSATPSITGLCCQARPRRSRHDIKKEYSTILFLTSPSSTNNCYYGRQRRTLRLAWLASFFLTLTLQTTQLLAEPPRASSYYVTCTSSAIYH